MSRAVMEWIGPTPNSAVPPRVKLRLWEKCGGICQGPCGIKIRDGWEADHTIALINGGQNREANLQILCIDCHAEKTGADVSEKSKTYRMRAKHLGIDLKQKRKFGSWR